MAKEYKKEGGGRRKRMRKKNGAKSFGFTVKVSEILRDTEKESKRAQNLMPKNKNNNNNKKNEAKLERLLKQRDFTPVLHFFLYLDFYSNVI